jgi:hypothetical protein
VGVDETPTMNNGCLSEALNAARARKDVRLLDGFRHKLPLSWPVVSASNIDAYYNGPSAAQVPS